MPGLPIVARNFPIEIAPRNWEIIAPLIELAVQLDHRVDAEAGDDTQPILVKLQAMAVHADLWAILRCMYPQVEHTPCRLNVEARKIEAWAYPISEDWVPEWN
jgi:hypothetical protein